MTTEGCPVSLRIVFVLPVGIERPSGVRYFNIARELVHRGHIVRILALHPDLHTCAERCFVQDGVQIWYMGQMHARKQGSQVDHFSLLGLLRVSLLSTIGLIWGILCSPANIYHVGKAQPINGLAALLGICLLRRQRFYLDCDDDETHSNRLTPMQRKIFAFWEWLLVKLTVGSTVNSRYLETRNRKAGNARVIYIPNGVDRQRFQSQPRLVDGLRDALSLRNCRVVAYFGSIALQNHPVDLLLDAFALVHQNAEDTRLLIIGGGEDLSVLYTQAERLGVAHAVLFTGHIPQTALPEFLSLANLSVDPVYDDSVARARSPLKIFESMAMGVPVVTATVGDRAEWLDNGAAGLLVEPGSAQALAEGIHRLLDDPIQCRILANNAQHRVRNIYTWSTLATAWLNLYDVRLLEEEEDESP